MPFTSHTVALPSGPVTYWEAGAGRSLLYLHAAGGHLAARAADRGTPP